MGTSNGSSHEGLQSPRSRRDFLRVGGSLALAGAAGLVGCGGGGGGGGAGGGGTPGSYLLRAQYGEVMVGDQMLMLPHYGSLPGPVIRTQPGATLRVTVQNDLPAHLGDDDEMMAMRGARGRHTTMLATTNLHTHGLEVSPSGQADNVFVHVEPGQTFEHVYALPADHPSGTFLYHPHVHGSTAQQIMAGMGGALIVEGGLDEVPEIRAAQDHVFLVQELRLTSEGHLASFFDGWARRNDQTLRPVNGELRPNFRCSPGELLRLRMINLSVQDYLRLSLGGEPFHLLARDAHHLAAPLPQSELLLTPGQRADVLVRFSNPGIYPLSAEPYDLGYGGLVDSTLLATVEVGGPRRPMPLPTSLPTESRRRPLAGRPIAARREVVFGIGSGGYVINGQFFSETRVDFNIGLGNVEEWTVSNLTGEDHPFHIHVNPFEVFEINGSAVAPYYVDTVNVSRGGSVRFRTEFLDFTGKYLYHCHNAFHSDMGMASLVRVT